jgi:predicted transcriptional regulator
VSQEVTFGGWLRQRRTELGLTREELSWRVGFSPCCASSNRESAAPQVR